MIAVHTIKDACKFLDLHKTRGIRPVCIPVSRGGYDSIFDELNGITWSPVTQDQMDPGFKIEIRGVPLRLMVEELDVAGYRRATKYERVGRI